jgi:transposase
VGKRKVYGSAFKAKVGLEAIRGVKTVNEIAQEHGVHPSQVAQWKRAIQEQAGSLFDGKRGPQPVDARSDPERLYSEIRRLKVELDWLKKSPDLASSRAEELGGSGLSASVESAMCVGRSSPGHGLRPTESRGARC